MNLKAKFDFLAQGYIQEYIEELYSNEDLRISLHCEKGKIWIEMLNKVIENLEANEGQRITKINNFIEVLIKEDSSEVSLVTPEFKVKRAEQLYESLIF